MSITIRDPKTIHLGGPIVRVNDIPAAGVLTPGMAIERNAGTYRVHAAGADGPLTLALNAPELNKTYEDTYAADDLVFAGVFPSGSTGLGWLASGENVADGAVLESAGAGFLRAKASGIGIARAIEAKDASSGDARIRVEAI